MYINQLSFNHNLKSWKKQFTLFAEMMGCSMILAKEINPDELVAIAYSHPSENNLLINLQHHNSFTLEIINENQIRSFSNLQFNDQYDSYIERQSGLKSFYGVPIYDPLGKVFGALCIYSRHLSDLSNKNIHYLKQIKTLLEDDLKIIKQSEQIKNIPQDTLLNDDEKFKYFFHYSPVGIFFFDKNKTITDCNEKFCDILKSNRATLLGLTMDKLQDKRIIPTIDCALLGVEDVYEGEYHLTTNNNIIYILLKTSPLYNQKKHISGGIGIIEDLSYKKNVEDALRESELKYKDLVEKINDVIFSIDKEGICTYISPVVNVLISYTPKEIIGHHFINFIQENYKLNFFAALNKVSTGANVVSEIKLRSKDGTDHWIKASMRPIYDNNGNYSGMHGIAQDIGEARMAELSLKESEKQFRLVATHISDIIFEWNPLNDELKWHGNPEVISPYLNSVKTFSQLNAFIHPDDKSLIVSNWHNALNSKIAWKQEFRICIPENKIIYIKGNGLILFKGEIGYKGFGTLTDISREKSLIANLQLTNEMLEENISKVNGLLLAIPDMMFVFNKEGIITDYHTNNEDALYCKSSHFINNHVTKTLPPNIADLTLKYIDKVLMHKNIETYRYALEVQNKICTYESRMVYLNPTHTLSIIRDVSEQEKAENDLIKAKEKAEESDRLKSSFLANMSHEIRTPMNGIIGFSELLKSKNLTPDDKHYYTSVIVDSGHQLLDIINDVLEISKIETGQISIHIAETDVHKLSESLVKFFRKRAEHKKNTLIIKTTNNGAQNIIKTDETKLRQILNNLVSNAIKFTKNGTIEIGYELKNNNTIEFYVQDSGIGIAPKEQSMIFQRFTQANSHIMPKNSGTGLGLSISKSLVELLGGQIWVDSKLNEGSRFTFSLPYQS